MLRLEIHLEALKEVKWKGWSEKVIRLGRFCGRNSGELG